MSEGQFFEISPEVLLKSQKKDDDRDLFLEEVNGEDALNWVNRQNEKSDRRIKSDKRFEELKRYNLSLLESKENLRYGSFQGDGRIYGFEVDERNKRGRLERISKEEYLNGVAKWELVLDLDQLAKEENENWVYKGAEFSKEADRALLRLSRGGSDAAVIREFDLIKKKFVENGFTVPEARSDVQWLGRDRVVISSTLETEARKNKKSKVEMPNSVQIWSRGEKLDEAQNVFKINKDDMSARIFVHESEDDEPRLFLTRAIDFFHREFYVYKEANSPQLIPLPKDIDIYGSFQKKFIGRLQSDWNLNDKKFLAGDFILIDVDRLLSQESNNSHSAVELLVRSRKHRIPSSVATTKESIYVEFLKDVKSEVSEFKWNGEKFEEKILDLPKFGDIAIVSSGRDGSDILFRTESFLTPKEIYHYGEKRVLRKIASLPPRFDSEKYLVKQFFAKSKDGTRIPYFVVHSKSVILDGKNPTIVNGYGGFKVSRMPYYSGILENSWLKKGGVFVLANIRGGGEYGPEWHQAGLKKNRHKVFEDFFSVAEDLISKKYTSPKYLGVKGGSNGGLLTGVAMTRRPDLYSAAIIDVPLLDMLRYHKLSVGGLWVGEYGDPEDPEMAHYIKGYSPYHNIRAEKKYLEPLVTTSTKDDRVHPGHARKFARKLERLNKPFLFFENIEGGHGGASNNEQRAEKFAREYVYLYQKLMD